MKAIPEEQADASKIYVRVPRISGYNKGENIRKSVEWIKNVLKTAPEVFDYIKPAR